MPLRILLTLLVACGAPAKSTTPTRPTTQTTQIAPTQPAKPTPTKPQPRAPSDVAGRIDGQVITIAELDRHIEARFKNELEWMDEAEREYRLAEERLRQLATLVDDRVLVAAALRARIEIPESAIDAALLELRTQNKLSEAELDKAIADSGYTTAAYRANLRDQLLAQAVTHREAKPNESLPDARGRLLERNRPMANVAIAIVLPPKPKLTNPIDASGLLSTDDLAATLKRTLPAFTTDRLNDEPRSRAYDSYHFQAGGKPESFDLAIRVWRGPVAAIDPKWQELQRALPKTVKDDQLATEAFSSQADKMFALGFVDRPTSVVVLVSCGSDLCKTADEMLAIARVVHGRLDRLAK